MPQGVPYLGVAGTLVALPSPQPGYDPSDTIRVARQEPLGGVVIDRLVTRRQFRLSWPAISDDNLSLIRTRTRLPGPYRYLHPLERNILTANQSTGTDELRTVEGFSARTQGTVASSTTFARSDARSVAWATGTPLASTDRGFALATSTTVDQTWAAVRPSTAYTISGYLRTSASVSMKAGFEWRDTAGAVIGSAVFGTGVAINTGDFNARPTHTATSPSNAAYAIPLFFNSTTTGAAITVYLDDPQLEEAGAASAWRLGAGTPLVSVESFHSEIVVADGASAWHAVELVLAEL